MKKPKCCFNCKMLYDVDKIYIKMLTGHLICEDCIEIARLTVLKRKLVELVDIEIPK